MAAVNTIYCGILEENGEQLDLKISSYKNI